MSSDRTPKAVQLPLLSIFFGAPASILRVWLPLLDKRPDKIRKENKVEMEEGSAEDLSKAMKLTYTGVVRHLSSLQQEGLIVSQHFI